MFIDIHMNYIVKKLCIVYVIDYLMYRHDDFQRHWNIKNSLSNIFHYHNLIKLRYTFSTVIV